MGQKFLNHNPHIGETHIVSAYNIYFYAINFVVTIPTLINCKYGMSVFLYSSTPHFIYTRAIWKVTSCELLTKQARGEKIYYIQKIHTYILKLLLNIVTARTEACIILGNKFLYVCVKEICCLWAQPRFDTFHQLLIIAEHCDPN
jgi:hypothetical protein